MLTIERFCLFEIVTEIHWHMERFRTPEKHTPRRTVDLQNVMNPHRRSRWIKKIVHIFFGLLHLHRKLNVWVHASFQFRFFFLTPIITHAITALLSATIVPYQHAPQPTAWNNEWRGTRWEIMLSKSVANLAPNRTHIASARGLFRLSLADHSHQSVRIVQGTRPLIAAETPQLKLTILEMWYWLSERD